MPGFLFGPIDDPAFADRLPADGWRTFSAACPSWAAAAGAAPPAALLVWPAYASVPAWVWSAPVPVVVLAADAHLLWEGYRHLLPLADLVLADAPSAGRLHAAGVGHARAANLFGLDRHALAGFGEPDGGRDIDVLFCGNTHPAVAAELLPWVGRLAALADRHRVVIAGGAPGAACRPLLRRARLVFNRSARGECNGRALEAAAAGAVLLQEAENDEVRAHLEPGTEYAPYTDSDFEAVVEGLLGDEGRRREIAGAARVRVRGCAFHALIEAALAVGGPGWVDVTDRAARRVHGRVVVPLAGRVWQRAALAAPDADPALLTDLAAAGGRHALGALARSASGAEPHLSIAATENRVSAVGRADALAELGRRGEAAEELRRTVAALDARPELTPAEADGVPYPTGFDSLWVGWQRAGFDRPGDAGAERREKALLLRGRALAMLAELTGDLDAYRAAADARPGVPAGRAALGCALARAGRFAEAVGHLAAACAGDPLDRPAARAFVQALADAGDSAGLRRATAGLRRLSAAAPDLFPPEPWFADPGPASAGGGRPTGGELASLVVLCCNEVGVTRLCLESVLAHTRRPYELVLVDNGSSDGTPDYLREAAARPGPDRVTVIRNGENRGYPAGVNQGLTAARGEYVVLLNNDVVVTPGWLDRLVRCALHDWPAVGLTGPVTNYAPPPQLADPDYQDLSGLDAFAARRAAGYAGRALGVDRLTGFCLLARREVLDRVGGLDERFGLGFFDDDDLCLRVRRAGFRLTVALDCYVHHFGSRTFRALGVDTARQLDDNLALYREKWGAGEAAKYRLPPRPPTGPAPGPPDPRVPLWSDEPVVAPSGPAPLWSDVPVVLPAAPPVPAVAGRPRVSLTMIVRNEEHNLPACLASVRDLVDEAVVVDTGSTDGTPGVIRSFGCVGGEFPWVDDFAAARNAALDRATGDYAFWMDADDRLDDENRATFRAVLAGLTGGNDAYVVKCLCVPDRPGAGGTVVDHVRLFRRVPQHRWAYRVHEQILPALRRTGADVRWSGVTVRHVGYLDSAVRRRKLDRDLRLLRLDEAERPDDPFTLFNLGAIYTELGDHRAAAGVLARSLAGSHPKDSIVRKLYALLAQCHTRCGDRARAEGALAEGLGRYPDDAELLFLSANLARERGDWRGAEGLYRRLVGGSEGDHFASVDAGLRAVKGRHNLAVLLAERGRGAEAEALWRAALTHDPHFLPSHVGLADLYLTAGNTAGFSAAAVEMRELGPDGAAEAAALEGRRLLRERNPGGATAVLEAAAREYPHAVGVRVALSHARLAAGAPPDTLEAAFRAVLELDPENAQARHNLSVLYRNTGRHVEGVLDPPGAAGGAAP